MDHYLLAMRALLFALSFAAAGVLFAPHPTIAEDEAATPPADPPSYSDTDKA